ncbi:ABC transporter ATP-binding protein [Siccirubricoccus deserti]|uniref:Urea ABC transporter ATP-binding protein UrtD n=1 Tax=Siccirubricoccus deserti TaxID=2013562 RepID=A0A9X0UDX1_9PROT|nr:urea ABC transporter ATP-binding protein UrtD [Siccirubricoccus deserti]MBC4016078.1 urea ABC transporter ATP-binding protein UrtD [Siccirubricoccus deserti]GGC46296.1 ABC transporter ATP-binding protein [Siccirubricoccus deserti]
MNASPASGTRPAPDPILYLDGVSVVFDGFKALNGLSLIVDPGELRAIIGPNGAGKTTMMDVITGKTRPTAGVVRFREHDLTRLDEATIANLGIGRKFQKPTMFDALTVFENLELALKAPRGPLACLRWVLDRGARRRIEQVLEEVGLTARMHDRAAILSHGQRQWLEIGMLLMQDPELLLVDEPVAGMTDQETEHTAALLVRIAGQRSVVVVEHDLEFVRALGSKVTVLCEGAMLSEGSIDHVQNDPRVIEVYLGR